MNVQDYIKQAKATANQSEETAGGADYQPPAEGQTPARFIEYIELGSHINLYEGKPKPPEYMVRVTFELLGKNYVREIDVEGGKKTVADRISMNMPIKTSAKAKFFKLMNCMLAGRTDITHMAEMLNEPFMVTIKHTKSEDGKKTFANIYDAKAQVWNVAAPRVNIVGDDGSVNSVDISGKVRAAVSPLKIFVWDYADKATWDTLFIDGERETKNADGTVTKESKNWLQEKMLDAVNLQGSKLESVLVGLKDLPTGNQKTASEDAPADTQTSATATNNGSTEDALAELGL